MQLWKDKGFIMHVQQERIDLFYRQIREELKTYYPGRERQHCDFAVVERRPITENLSVDYWKEKIADRMDFNPYLYSDDSPFYAYFVNRPWLRLAYDLAKMDSSNSYEYRKNWLKVIYPNINFKINAEGQEIEHYLNPITFKASVGFGTTRVLLTKTMPSFITYEEIINSPKDSPGRLRLFYDYYTKFAESYIYVLSSRQLYFIFSDGEIERIDIPPENNNKFQNDFYRLLGIRQNIEITQRMEEDRCFIASRGSLEQVIVQNGAYPILDLRAFYINADEKTRIYNVASYFYPRDMVLKTNYKPDKFIPLKSSYELYGEEYKDFEKYTDILSQVVYDDYRSIKPRPLSIVEYQSLVDKNCNMQFGDGEEAIFRARRLVIKVFRCKWEKMEVDIPRHYLISLLNTLKGFSKLPDNSGGFEGIKSKLNTWSKTVGTTNVIKLFSKYKHDFRHLMPESEITRFLKKIRETQGKSAWRYSGIRQLHKLYSLTIPKMKAAKEFESHNFLNIMIDVMQAMNNSGFIRNSEPLVAYCLLEQLDMFHFFADTDTPHIKEIKKGILSNRQLRTAFEKLLPTCPEACKEDLISVLHTINDAEDMPHFNASTISTINRIFEEYDNEVANTRYDHTLAQSPERAAWPDLAKLLTGLGYFPDYLQLLCPRLLTYIDNVTGRLISEFDIRHLIFSSDRRYLINLTYSLDLFELTGKAFDCSLPKLRYLDRDELLQVSRAHSVYAKFYQSMQASLFQQELFPFRFVIGLYRLVTTTNYPVKNRSSYYCINTRSTGVEEYKITDVMRDAYSYAVGYVNIALRLSDNDLNYFIDFRKASKENVSGQIPLSELVNPISQEDIDRGINEHQNSEIIYLLRKNGSLPFEFGSDMEVNIDREYLIFRRLYNSLSVKQRNFLNSNTIENNNNVICFWDVFKNSRFDIKKANGLFLEFLVGFYPEFKFSTQISREYSSALHLLKGAKPKLMADPNLDLDKLLISFLTNTFVPPGSIPSGWDHCSFMDVQVRFPQHATLVNIFDIFYNNYMGLTKDMSFISPSKIHALASEFNDCSQTDERKFSGDDGNLTTDTSLGSEVVTVAKESTEVDGNTDKEDCSDKESSKDQPKVTDKLSFQVQIYLNALYKGFDQYHYSKNEMHRNGYFAAVYEWVEWVVSGEMFNDMPILEYEEIIEIVKTLKRKGLSFPENPVSIINSILDIKFLGNESQSRENRCILNILCIRLFRNLTRDDFILVFKAIFPELETEVLHRVLKLYLISHNEKSMQYVSLINAVKKILGLDLFAMSRLFLTDKRARIGFSPQKIHFAINQMAVIPNVEDTNDTDIDDTGSVSSGIFF